MGFGWIYLVAKLVCPGIKIVSYSHYPFISSDMVKKVASGVEDYNNSASISQSLFKSKLKLLYYKFILMLYKFVGRFVDFVMANSTWTYNHFLSLWNLNKDTLCKLYIPGINLATHHAL
jgi:alpha-1,2-mannosyltransferase